MERLFAENVALYWDKLSSPWISTSNRLKDRMTMPISVEGFSKSMSARKAGHSKLTIWGARKLQPRRVSMILTRLKSIARIIDAH